MSKAMEAVIRSLEELRHERYLREVAAREAAKAAQAEKK